jgi:hypothetical protein
MNAVVNDQQAPKDPRKGTIVLLNENFETREVALDDLKVTGRQIAEAAGYHSTDEVVVLQQLPSGSLEEIRPEELVDLGAPGVERFFVMEADSTFRFIVDGLKLEWPRASISAKTIRKLALKDESYDVVQELEDAPDRTLDEDDVVNLKGAGTERFKTKHGPKLVTVYYGETPYELAKGTYTTEQLIETFSVEAGYLLDLIEDGKLIELKAGEKIRIKNGMHFTSHPPRGQSS